MLGRKYIKRIKLLSSIRIDEKFMLNNNEKQNEKMTIWFVLGPIGAGKSSYINKILSKCKLVFLSPDLIEKERKISYSETRELMENIMKQHVENRISFIIEGTGQHDDLYDLLVEYKKKIQQ